MFAPPKGSVVQWIECQIPVLMIWVRVPSGSQKRGCLNLFETASFFVMWINVKIPKRRFFVSGFE